MRRKEEEKRARLEPGVPRGLALAYDEELAAEEAPEEREAQVHAQRPHRRAEAARHRVREEAPDARLHREAAHLHRLLQREVRERRVVVEEVPVAPVQDADVRAEADEASAGLQATPRLAERAHDRGLVGQVLEEVARDHAVERGIR